MGVEGRKRSAPPLPAPTETNSTLLTIPPSEVGTDVSRPDDDKSSYSLPDDGTPVTIKAGHRASRSQTSLLIEYFEGSKTGSTGGGDQRKPSVRVRLTPSSKSRSKGGSDRDRIEITQTKSRKTSASRRAAPTSNPTRSEVEGLSVLSGDMEDASSYASATEESTVSRNPIDIEIDRGGNVRRRRPASPLIPAADSKASYNAPTMSEISAIPADSFLDGSGHTSFGMSEVNKSSRSRSPSRTGDYLLGAAAGLGAAAAADKLRIKSRGDREKDRVLVSKNRDKEKDRKHRSSKSRTSSLSKEERYSERAKSPRRRSKGQTESLVSGADSSVISSAFAPSHRSMDQHSIRSGASKASSINNPKLLETVEDAIRRLILPELNALKREQSKHKTRRDSITSSTTTASRDDYPSDRRRSGLDKNAPNPRDSIRSRESRDREARNDFDDSSALSHDSVEDDRSIDDTPIRSNDRLKSTMAGAAMGAAAVAAANEMLQSPSDDKQRSRRRRRAEMRSRGSEQAPEDEDSELLGPPMPPMPLMSDANASDVTRASIMSAETDRPHSASEQAHQLSPGSTPTPTGTPMTLQASLGTQHANISHGDLKQLPRQRTGEWDEYIIDDNGKRVLSRASKHYQDDDEYDESSPSYAPESPFDYYSTQDVPPPLNYVPYQPERRGLSPIPSVSGYTEASEVPRRESRASHRTADSVSSIDRAPLQNGSMRSHASRDFAAVDSARSSLVDGNNAAMGSPGGSELDRIASGQAVRAVGLNPDFVHMQGVESNVASLVDGSMLDSSVLTTSSSALGANQQYTNGRESMATLEEERSRGPGTPGQRSAASQRDYIAGTPGQQSLASLREYEGTPGQQSLASLREYQGTPGQQSLASLREYQGTPGQQSLASLREYQGTPGQQSAASLLEYRGTPGQQSLASQRDYPGTPGQQSAANQRDYVDDRAESAASGSHKSREFVEYDLDEYGRKVPQTNYHHHSPTMSEAAITSAAVGAAAAVLRAQNANKEHQVISDDAIDFQGAGVQRNKSFKERTNGGPRPGIDTASAEQLVQNDDKPKLGFSGMPDLNDPMPEIGDWNDDDMLTNPSLLNGHGGRDEEEEEERWAGDVTPRQHPQHLDDDVNYQQLDGSHASPATPQQRSQHDLGLTGIAGAAAQSHSGEEHDEWYRSAEDKKRDTLVTNPYEDSSPIANISGIGNGLLGGPGFDPAGFADLYGTRTPLGHKVDEGYISQGPNKTPDFQAKGKGVDFDESKDIIALMQHLMVRDAQRSARDTEILVTLVRSATEMRNNFEDLKRLLADTEDVIITEVKENTDKTVQRAINGPRPYPGSAPRSIQGGSAAGTINDDVNAKKRSIFRRALKGLNAKGANDLGRIEDMLMQLLNEVDVLKAQTAPVHGSQSNQGDNSYDHIQPEVQDEQDHGYEPEGMAGTSTASHPSQSGYLSLHSRGTSSVKPGYDRKASAHRISTVPEDNEEDYDHGRRNDDLHLMTPAQEQRGGSVPLATPPGTVGQMQTSMSNENTPRTEESGGKKKGRSSWFRIPKISRWSETTASSGVPESRHSKQSSKDEGNHFAANPSRSGSLDHYQDNYQFSAPAPIQTDKLHTGFSETDLARGGYREDDDQLYTHQQMSSPASQANWVSMNAMTPEDPKYKAHRDSLNLVHPQPRQGQTERFKAALESQALGYDSPLSPKSADWAGSVTSLNRYGTGHHAAENANSVESGYGTMTHGVPTASYAQWAEADDAYGWEGDGKGEFVGG
ncbi:hypothetical protein N0V88_002450 [Collariella sp. IMI 366227]|nr:hypothetical protein N0V88_002450 [Collariella sp. IMI 366227]